MYERERECPVNKKDSPVFRLSKGVGEDKEFRMLSKEGMGSTSCLLGWIGLGDINYYSSYYQQLESVIAYCLTPCPRF